MTACRNTQQPSAGKFQFKPRRTTLNCTNFHALWQAVVEFHHNTKWEGRGSRSAAYTNGLWTTQRTAYLSYDLRRVKGPIWHCIVGRNFGSFVRRGHAWLWPEQFLSQRCRSQLQPALEVFTNQGQHNTLIKLREVYINPRSYTVNGPGMSGPNLNSPNLGRAYEYEHYQFERYKQEAPKLMLPLSENKKPASCSKKLRTHILAPCTTVAVATTPPPLSSPSTSPAIPQAENQPLD
ncbi:hypothetical protein G7Y89_g5553 [Cudoniella acicularis]|uniref:Uncharacterized protein n=1 Tax=Cudoniella acicularis TaxID=354080 RepID=A0A8H4RPJ5_9HELO|nr:hypothetical protein G7Y89_g5553 [Cudoniella acicularis]